MPLTMKPDISSLWCIIYPKRTSWIVSLKTPLVSWPDRCFKYDPAGSSWLESRPAKVPLWGQANSPKACLQATNAHTTRLWTITGRLQKNPVYCLSSFPSNKPLLVFHWGSWNSHPKASPWCTPHTASPRTHLTQNWIHPGWSSSDLLQLYWLSTMKL